MPLPSESRIALVTGANRGIGFATARLLAERGWRVMLTARDPVRGAAAAAKLAGASLDVQFAPLNVTDPASLASIERRLAEQALQIDVLINNAGVYSTGPLLDCAIDDLRQVIEVNVYGALRLAQTFVPAMRARGYGRVVNLSSGYGSFARGVGGPGAYSVSKAALNAITVRLAAEAGAGVKVNAVDPGWVRTRMGGERAPHSVIEAAADVVWLATLANGGPSGGFFYRRRPVPW